MVLEVYINNNGQKCQKSFVKNLKDGHCLSIILLENLTALYLKQFINKRKEIISHSSLSHLPLANKTSALILILYIFLYHTSI